MDELDREMILADRAEARDAAMERKRAEQALKQQQEQQQRAAEKVPFTATGTSSGGGQPAPCPAVVSFIDHRESKEMLKKAYKAR